MNTLELIEVFTDNIADDILEIRKQKLDNYLEEYLEENFNFLWLESTDEWVVSFGDSIIIDGLSNEWQAMDTFYFLENLAFSKYYKLMKDQLKELQLS